jgi:hypothetical protein
LNITGPEQQLLTIVWIISTFIPTLKIPILYVYGEKESGKTFFTKAFAQLADPTVKDPSPDNDVKVLASPRHEKKHCSSSCCTIYSSKGRRARRVKFDSIGSGKRVHADAHSHLFEFSFGHFVEGLSVDTMLADYNMLNGRLFILVLLSAFIAPVVCGWALARKKR